MKEQYVNEKTGIQYRLQGDYYVPCLAVPEQPEVNLGPYAQMHCRYLKEKHRVKYYNLLTDLKLAEYLSDVEQRALQMEESLTVQLAQQEGITEQLKAEDPMEWVRRMNSIRDRVREIVKNEIIYA